MEKKKRVEELNEFGLKKKDVFKPMTVGETTVSECLTETVVVVLRLDGCFFSIMICNTTFLVCFVF